MNERDGMAQTSETAMSWTEERIDLLQKLWLQGMSASRIARELANGLTRNAVIGKVYRLGLSGRVKEAAADGGAPPAERKSRPRPAAPRQTAPRPLARAASGVSAFVRGNAALAMQPVAYAPPAPGPQSEVVVPIVEPVTILDLRDSMCRWPLGDPTQPEFRFCGARKTPGDGPYCRCHAAIAYQPQNDRRRRQHQKSA
jgi:GcrA cell cycle regulator